jgi:hypothetical protein
MSANPGRPVARLLGKIRAAEKGLAVLGREKHGERPTAAAVSDQLLRDLVNSVEIRPFLPVDFDVDELSIHQRGDRGIFERLVCHDVAPVAGRVAHRQEDGLVFALGGGQRGFAPGIPIHRIVRVLQQIGAGFLVEAIALHVRGRGRLECRPL